METSHEAMRNNFEHLIKDGGSADHKVHGQIGLLLLELVEIIQGVDGCDGNCDGCNCENSCACGEDCNCDKSAALNVEEIKAKMDNDPNYIPMIAVPKKRGRPPKNYVADNIDAAPLASSQPKYTTTKDVI